VSQPVRSLRGLNPLTRTSKREFFEGIPNMHFEAKKVIVVGGSAGMGRQVAIDVVDHGGSAVIVGRSKARVDDTVAELTSRCGEAWGIAADLADRAAVADVQRAFSEHHNDATLLVNAAGFFIPKPFLEYDAQDYDSYMELNYALFFLTQTVVAGMIARGEGGSIVNIGSMWAHQALGLTPSTGHSMQKAGLHALTHNLAIELAGHNIRVNAVAPAAVKTPALERWSRRTRSTPHSILSRRFTPWGESAPLPMSPTPSRICSLMRLVG
jgi:NAD(P)-dependent dehydrogenase (short-subunit alcohol dehydrogenase family)